MDLDAILVVGIITLGIYRLFELYVKKKERIMLIEKLGNGINPSDSNIKLNLSVSRSSTNWALKISLLLIGIGMGIVVAYFIEIGSGGGYINYEREFQHKIEVVYLACVAIFGGIGLLAAYFIERNEIRKEKELPNKKD